MYYARNNYFESYKFLTTCILQFTRSQQLVNFRVIQNWWRHDDVIPYIGNFSRGFNFRWVRDLPEIAKNRHSEKLTLLYVFIESHWNSKNRTQWKFNTPSKRHFRQNFPTRKIPDIRYAWIP